MTKQNWTRTRRSFALALLVVSGACDSGNSSGAAPDPGDDADASTAGSGPVPMAGHSAAGSGAGGGGAAGSGVAGSAAAGRGGMAGKDGAGAGGSAGDDAGADAGAPGGGGAGLTFEADIYPLLVGSCGSCHGSSSGGPPRPGGPGEGGSNAPGKFAVDDEAASYTAAMPYVVAGDAEASALFIKVNEDMPSTGGARMPPALRQWDDASINALRDWIDQGAVEH